MSQDPFDLLGIAPAFELDTTALEQRHRELSRVLHPDKHLGESASQRRILLGKAIAVNDALRVLKDPVQRAQVLLARQGLVLTESEAPRPDPAFLMELMEQRELLSEAKRTRDRAGVAHLATRIRNEQSATLEGLAAGFRDVKQEDRGSLTELARLVGKLRYHRRFLEEVRTIEDLLSTYPPALDEPGSTS